MDDWQKQYSNDPDVIIRWIIGSYLGLAAEGDWSECIRRLCRNRDSEIERLRAELVKCKLDADRYRWLKSAKGLTLYSLPSEVWTREDGTTFIATHSLAAFGTQYGAGEGLDATIDAALAAKEE